MYVHLPTYLYVWYGLVYVSKAKDMIVSAKDAEKRGDLPEALRLYQAAHLLLPTHLKLGQVGRYIDS